MAEKENKLIKSKDLVRVPFDVWKALWIRTLDGLWNGPWNDMKQLFSKTCPNAYIIKCPKCKSGKVELQQGDQNLFECKNGDCGCKFSLTIKEIFDRKPQNEPSNMTLAIGIGSPTEDWDQIQEGASLASFLNQLNKEDDLWFARVPEKYLFPSDGVEERHLLLLIIDGIKTTQEGDDVFRSRLAIRKLLRDNGDAVLRQIVWITDEQLKISNLELRRP